MTGLAEAIQNTPPASQKHGKWVLLLLSLFGAIAPLSVDLYLPGLPAIAAEFHTSTASVQLTLSAFLVGFGGGQLFWGPLGDRYGRRGPIAAGLILFTVASLGCAFSQSVWQIVAWRFLQALGGCAPAVLSSAMVRDIYEGHEAVRIRSQIQLITLAAPLFAPLIGGQILIFLPWQAVFAILAFVGIIGLIGIWRLAETLPHHFRRSGRAIDIIRTYLHFFTDRHFIGCALTAGFLQAGMLAFITGSPFVYIQYYGVPVRYFGFLFGLNVLGMMATGRLNGLFSRHFSPPQLLRFAAICAACAGAICILQGQTGAGGLWGLVPLIVVFVSVQGIASPNAMVSALEAHPDKAGSASALIGSLGITFGAGSGVLLGVLTDGTPRPLTLVMGAMGFCALAANLTLMHRRA